MTGTDSDQLLFHRSSGLRELDLSYSGLHINIESDPWIPPFQLETLNFSSCNIGSPIPGWISTQFALETLNLSNANLVEELPSWLWEFSSKLKRLNLSNNHLEGPLTVSVASHQIQLQVLDLSVNELNGPLLLDIHIPKFPLKFEVLLPVDNKLKDQY